MTEAEQRFIEQMGVISQRNGSPRISGRIFGLLILRGKAVPLQEIAESLQVSKASASTNARQLRDKGMLRLTTQPGERQDYYELVPNPFQSMLTTLSQEMNQAAGEIAETMTAFDGKPDDVVQRIGDLQKFYQASANFLTGVSENLSKSSINPVGMSVPESSSE
jgi:DNA-binding transcriptional regulator GbsR (MarR family)